MIIFPPFRRVGILPVGQVLVLRVPEHQIGDVQLLCQPAGIHDRAVVLFVGLEAVALAVQAERLMEQPLGAFDPGQQRFMVRLVARKGKLHAVVHPHPVAELFCLGGTDVKKCEAVPQDLSFVAAFHHMEQDTVVKMRREFFPDGQAGEGLDGIYQLPVAVNMQIAFIVSLIHAGGDHPDDPDHAENVVVVGMGDKNVVDLLQRDVLLFPTMRNTEK